MKLTADKQEIERRREVCAACPHRQRDGMFKLWRCALCGCPVTTKTLFSADTCPEHRW